MALSSTLQPARGFHFEYSTTLSLQDSKPGCIPYLLYVLPADVFVDKYELKQRALSFTLHGHADLELPLVAVSDAPSVLEIRVPPGRLEEITVRFALHARYPRPSKSAYSTVQIPEPQAFWACPVTNKPTERDATFRHIPPQYVPSFDLDVWGVTFFNTKSSVRFHDVQVPAGNPGDVQMVEFGTIFTVIVVFLFVARAIWKTAACLSQPTAHMKRG